MWERLTLTNSSMLGNPNFLAATSNQAMVKCFHMSHNIECRMLSQSKFSECMEKSFQSDWLHLVFCGCLGWRTRSNTQDTETLRRLFIVISDRDAVHETCVMKEFCTVGNRYYDFQCTIQHCTINYTFPCCMCSKGPSGSSRVTTVSLYLWVWRLWNDYVRSGHLRISCDEGSMRTWG